MMPDVPKTTIAIWRQDAVVLFEWLMSVDLDQVPITHPAEKQALIDLLTRLEETDVTDVSQEDIDQARVDVGTGSAWSFATSLADVATRRAEADRLVGEEIRAVRYFTIDYRAMDDPDRPAGPRTVASSEPADGLWALGEVHSIDFGVEIETASSRVFAITWDPPGAMEGIGLRERRLIGSALHSDWDGAVWDVTSSALWSPLVGRRIGTVALDYRPWSDDGDWWCPVLTITSENIGVVLGLGEVGPDGALAPSADNVLALAHPTGAEFPIPGSQR